MEERKVVTVARMCKVGETNANGVRYTEESYRKALNDDVFKELLESGRMLVGFHAPSTREMFNVPLDQAAGSITSITDEDVTFIPREKFADEIIKQIEAGKLKMGMNYFGETKTEEDGHITATIDRICSFSLCKVN